MSPKQSNTQEGVLNALADTNLAAAIAAGTDIRGKLVKQTAGGKVEIPTAVTDVTPFIVEDVLDSTNVTVRPLHGNRNVRIPATGTGNSGDPVYSDSAAYGSIKKYTTGAAYVIGYAEENWVAGQLLLVRPQPHIRGAVGTIAAQSTPAITGVAATINALTVDNPPTQAQVTAIRDQLKLVADDVKAISDAIVAAGIFS